MLINDPFLSQGVHDVGVGQGKCRLHSCWVLEGGEFDDDVIDDDEFQEHCCWVLEGGEFDDDYDYGDDDDAFQEHCVGSWKVESGVYL